ncbi:MAG: hypothetical protein HQL51_03020 [Magnetococcales bacterium]|nr:hypothetical protein [Magnetococcales bacterium]
MMHLLDMLSYAGIIGSVVGIALMVRDGFVNKNIDWACSNRVPLLISQDRLGEIERGITGLKRVIVLLKSIEASGGTPKNLRNAVISNLARGVDYIFLCEKQNMAEAKYAELANKYCEIVRLENVGNDDVGVIDVVYYEKEWDQVPYIYYEIEDDNGGRYVYVYMGNVAGSGISKSYRLVQDVHSSIAILYSIKPMNVDASISNKLDNVFDFAQAQPRKKRVTMN